MRAHTNIVAVIAAVFMIRPATSLSAEGSDACSLLTEARVSALLGVSVGAGEHLVPKTPSLCGWAQPGDTNHSGKRVVLDVFGTMGHLTPVDRFNNGKTPVKSITKTPVTGVGDDAYYVTTPAVGTGLNVKKGSSVFQIRVYGFAVEQIKEIEKSLAHDVLAKI